MMKIVIDPACYTDPTSAQYNAPLGDLYKQDRIHKARIVIEIDSVGAPSTLIFPVNNSVDRALGGNSQRSVYITYQGRLVDETYLSHADSGLQGSFMSQLAKYVKLGVLKVTDVTTGTVRTADNIISWSYTGTWA